MAKKDNFHQSKAWQEWLSDDIVPSVASKRARPSKEKFSYSLERQPADSIDNKAIVQHKVEQKQPPIPHGRTDYRNAVSTAPIKPTQRSHQAEGQALDLPSRAASKPQKQARPSIAISLTLPKLRASRLKSLLRQLPVSYTQALAALLGVAVLLTGGWLIVRSLDHAPKRSGPPKTTAAVATDLGFVPFAPAGRGKIVPGQANPYYNTSKKFYQYTETYNGASITINEQPFPEKLKQKAELDKFLRSFTAVDSFTTTLGTVHVSTDQTAGSQRLALTNSYMLMFIQSTKSFPNEDWTRYIESFERIQ